MQKELKKTSVLLAAKLYLLLLNEGKVTPELNETCAVCTEVERHSQTSLKDYIYK